MSLKVAMIGAGSTGFTRRLMRDILSVPELADTRFAFTDISQHNLDMVTQLCRRDIEANHLPAVVEASTDRRKTIAESDYVICMIRQGGLEAFQTDIDIPLKYGIDQCVGDTICAGGLMYGQRTIPALLDFCRDIREVAKPDALFLNYTTPMAMNTWACNIYGGVQTIGLCHGVQHSHWQITHCIELWAKQEGLLPADAKLDRHDVDIIAAGINHQTWFIKVEWRGMNMLPRLLSLFEQHPEYSHTEKVRIDMLRRFGYYSTESNGHLSEYVPWYRKRTDEIGQWIDLSSWIKETPPVFGADTRSEEHGSYIIEALETGRIYRGHFNVVNQGHITNLPDGCVIEIPGYVDRTGINMPVVGALPMACAATCSVSVRVQEMAMEAAVHGDVTLLKQAMLHDPLVGAVCNPPEVWQLTDEMLVAQAKWLPQYQGEIAGAQQRLDDAVKNGTRVHLQETHGAARIEVKTVEVMQRNQARARANADAADKAAVGD